jgi:hypothetical protein
LKFVGDAEQSGDVVSVFVTDENRAQIFRCAVDAGKALADLARAEPGAHKYPGISSFEIGAIAGRTASENGEADGHKRTLVWADNRANFFALEFDGGTKPA